MLYQLWDSYWLSMILKKCHLKSSNLSNSKYLSFSLRILALEEVPSGQTIMRLSLSAPPLSWKLKNTHQNIIYWYEALVQKRRGLHTCTGHSSCPLHSFLHILLSITILTRPAQLPPSWMSHQIPPLSNPKASPHFHANETLCSLGHSGPCCSSLLFHLPSPGRPFSPCSDVSHLKAGILWCIQHVLDT